MSPDTRLPFGPSVGAAVRIVAAVVLAALSSGCVSAGLVGTDIWHSLTPDQQAEARVVEDVLAKLSAECQTRLPASSCVPAHVVMVNWGSDKLTLQYQRTGHVILVPPRPSILLTAPSWLARLRIRGIPRR